MRSVSRDDAMLLWADSSITATPRGLASLEGNLLSLSSLLPRAVQSLEGPSVYCQAQQRLQQPTTQLQRVFLLARGH